MKKIHFPTDFLWGSSTAAAQVETASEHNWRGLRAKDGYIFSRTTDHEKRRTEDIDIIKQFGTIYRCGVDWARLQSSAFAPFDVAVVAEYEAFFRRLNEEGMKIMFVIHHFTNPLWFERQNGWLSTDNIPAFLDFAKQCIQHFGKYVFIWNTFNEPNVYALNGFITGDFPPHKKNILKASRVIRNMGKAHGLVFDLLKENSPEKRVGISLNTAVFEGLNLVGKAVAKFTDWWFHRFVSSKFQKVDFWGLSYYAYIPFKPMAITEISMPGKLAEMGIRHDKMWGYKPEGLLQNMKRLYIWYGKPLFVTENGICSDDPQERIESLRDYLRVCHRAIYEDKLPLLGYIHWSTWDNFEWNLGPTYRFGLVRINLDDMSRQHTPAADFYAKVTRENAVE